MHYKICEAAICCGDPNPNYKKEVTWFPGEAICTKIKPADKFIKIQKRINKKVEKGTFKYLNTFFTASMLEKVRFVTNGFKGLDPERDFDSQIAIFNKKYPSARLPCNIKGLKAGIAYQIKKGTNKPPTRVVLTPPSVSRNQPK